jgi:hypothetical protein
MKPMRWFTESLREWSWRHTGLGLLVGTLTLSNMGGFLAFPDDFPWLRSWVYNIVQFGFPLILALRIADRAVADGAARSLAYGTAVVGTLALGVWVIGPLLSPLIGGDPEWDTRQDVMLFCRMLLPCAIATVAYAHWRRERDTLARLQSAEVERAQQAQLVESARLLTLQARVEPQFLFDTLQRVRNLIDASADAAQSRLDDLIALLRAMQPATGATASTVAREFALVQAYGRASEAGALSPPRLALETTDEVADARLAPLVLLPALRRLAGDAPDAQWQVRAERLGERLHLLIAPRAALQRARAGLQSFDGAAARARLAAVHGEETALAVDFAEPPSLHISAPLRVAAPSTEAV